MLTKTYTARVKALKADDGADTGELEMLVAAFGNVDHVGDRAMPEMFDKTLAEWRESGDPIPMIFSHQWENPFAHIGAWDARKSEVTPEGLLLRGKVDLDNEFARQVFTLIKQRRVREASFGYEVIREKTAKDGANELLEVDLVEAGPALKGVNPLARLVSAKSDPCPTCGRSAKAEIEENEGETQTNPNAEPAETEHAEESEEAPNEPVTEPEPIRAPKFSDEDRQVLADAELLLQRLKLEAAAAQ